MRSRFVAASVALALATGGCRGRDDAGALRVTGAVPDAAVAAAVTQVEPAPTACPAATSEARTTPPPRYLSRMATLDLYLRTSDGGIANAGPDDVAVVRGYPTAAVRGPLVDGLRITLMTAKTRVAKGEEVRVLHVVEAEAAGKELYVMGPKPVVGEYLDGKLVTPPVPSVGAFTTEVYDGAVLQSPEVDTNYDPTRYTFASAGIHRIEWRDGAHRSNVLCIEVR